MTTDKAAEKYPTAITINNILIPDRSVNMTLASLDDRRPYIAAASGHAIDLGNHPLPPGYQLREYRSGDQQIWTQIQRAAEPFFAIEDDLFDKQYGSHPEELPKRMFFIDWLGESGSGDGGIKEPIGTASAWWKDNWKTEDPATGQPVDRGAWGQVHWVAIKPEHQKKGLAKPLMAQVMKTLAQSHRRAMLGTSTGRVWAIKVYLDLGFVPDEQGLADPKVHETWLQLQQVLHHPSLAALALEG